MKTFEEAFSKTLKIGIYSTIAIYSLIGIESIFRRGNYIPGANKVQQGYAIPNKIGINLEDIDKNGEDETIFKYGGKSYLLRVDEQNRPYISEYEVRPAEVIPRTKETRILEKEK